MISTSKAWHLTINDILSTANYQLQTIMPNSYFRFKQFTVHQDRVAMKVCTDSCILGAWTALRLGKATKVLDIGTGTGLLPLMLAQKTNVFIDTIESDPDAASQAAENIQASSWSDRIAGILEDVRSFTFADKYDFIITNPPFFESDLRSPEKKKNISKHDESLTLDQLITVIRSNLNVPGAFAILLPFHRTDYFYELATKNEFFLQEKLIVKQTPKHEPFRSVSLYKNKNQGKIVTDELTIKNAEGKYTAEFMALMQDYYG